MPDSTPPRRPIATFLRPAPGDSPDGESDGARAPATDGIDAIAGDERIADTRPETTPEGALPEPVAPVAVAVADTAAPAARSAHEPVFLRRSTPSLPAPRWQWLAVAGLVLLLVLQVALADRARLAADAGTRPWVAGLCSVLGCSLPAWREPSAFTMTSRDVRPVPGHASTLQVRASLRNDARWAQDWPTLRLSLSDADGRVIGTGVFKPADYLGAQAAQATPLEPGQSAQIAFRVREPAASTVAFTFEFM